MAGCNALIDEICVRWSLPKLQSTSGADSFSLLRLHLPASALQPPPVPFHPLDKRWGGDCSRIWIQVDCQSLAEVLSGNAVLQGGDQQPLFVRVARWFFRLADCGWLPIRDNLALVIWSPREYNLVGDHAVNACLDEGKSFEIGSPQDVRDAVAQHKNIEFVSTAA